MQKKEIKEEQKNQLTSIPPIKEPHNKLLHFKRENSMKNLNKEKKNEKIVPLKRITKSREKEIKRSPFLPLIKNNSFRSKTKINNIPKPSNVIKKKDSFNEKLPNLIIKKPLSNTLSKRNSFKRKSEKKNEIIENCKNSEVDKNQEEEMRNNIDIDNITKFYEELIELSISLPNKNLFSSLINAFNKKYLFNYLSNSTISKIKDIQFNECLKYSFILIACLIFLSKDEGNHKYTNQKLQELLDQFIFISLKNIKIINSSVKIKAFIGRMKSTKKSLYNSINSIIKLLFNNRNEYNALKNAFNQIVTNINKLNLIDISNVINNTILYCFNYQNIMKNVLKNNINNNNKKKNKRLSKGNIEINPNENDLIPTAPYIKPEMKKKFCLVLDIDETITHTLKLPMGDYFLVRPGVKEFLEEMAKNFEVVVFTSSPKSYADNILDKIDINNEYFNYRLYRRHVTYENGVSIKKLNMIGRDLKKVIFVDNLKANAKYNMNNLYHIKSWYSDIMDNQLILLKNKLKDIVISGKFDDDITKCICEL